MARQKLDISQEGVWAGCHSLRWLLRLWPLALIGLNVIASMVSGSLLSQDDRANIRQGLDRVEQSAEPHVMLFVFAQQIMSLMILCTLLLAVFHSLRASFREPSLVVLKDGVLPKPVDHPDAMAERSDIQSIKSGRLVGLSYLITFSRDPSAMGRVGLRMPWPLGLVPMRWVVFTGWHLSQGARLVADRLRDAQITAR